MGGGRRGTRARNGAPLPGWPPSSHFAKVHSVHIQQKHRLTLRLGGRTDDDVDHPSALLLGGVRVVGNHQPNLSLLANVVHILTTTVKPRAKRSDATAVAKVASVSERRKVAAAAITYHISFMHLGAN